MHGMVDDLARHDRVERSKRSVALATSAVLLGSGILAVLATAQGLYARWVQQEPTNAALTTTTVPLLFYLAWMCAATGLAGAVITLFVEEYRTRWFWRCLCMAAILWALMAPMGTVIGLIGMILLIATRSKFPKHFVARSAV